MGNKSSNDAKHQFEENYVLKAIRAGKTFTAISKLLNSYDLNFQDEDGLTALHVAVRYGRLKIVEELLMLGANAKLTDKEGNSPLHYAVKNHGLQDDLDECQNKLKINSQEVSNLIVKLLINANANPNLRNKKGLAPLHIAVQGENNTLVKSLLKANANPNLTDNEGNTALHHAVACSNVYKSFILNALLEAKANPNQKNKKNNTPLHQVVSYQKENELAVQKLLEAKADPSITNDSGETPIHIAARQGYGKSIKCFISNKFNIDQEATIAHSLQTPLSQAVKEIRLTGLTGEEFIVKCENIIDVVTSLLKAGANPFKVHTAYDISIESSFYQLALKLVENKKNQLHCLRLFIPVSELNDEEKCFVSAITPKIKSN